MERIVSSVGAPRYTEGMKSTSVCVIARATIAVARMSGSNDLKNGFAASATRNTATRLLWSPGARPVITPPTSPAQSAMAIAIIST